MTIVLCLYTYSPDAVHPRSEYTRKTLSAALSKIKTSHDMHLHIADDGSGGDHISSLVQIANSFGYQTWEDLTITNAKRGGYGKSYNLASQVVNPGGDFILSLEDDWELSRELELDPLIKALEESDAGSIRLGYLGWYETLVGKLVRYADQNFLRFLPEHCNDPHIWTGHPRLETREWRERLGAWPEGLEPGMTEMAVCNMPAAREGVLWPLDLIKTWGDLFEHIGTERAR